MTTNNDRELSDEQIYDRSCDYDECKTYDDIIGFARAVIAADRALRVEAAAQDAEGAQATQAVGADTWKELDGKATTAYCRYIEQMKRDACLGWEHKVKHGKFGEAELKAHCTAAEYLGMHRAYADASNLAHSAIASTPQANGPAEPVPEGCCSNPQECTDLRCAESNPRKEPGLAGAPTDTQRLDWLLPNLHPATWGMEFPGGYEWADDAEFLAKWRAAIDEALATQAASTRAETQS